MEKREEAAESASGGGGGASSRLRMDDSDLVRDRLEYDGSDSVYGSCCLMMSADEAPATVGSRVCLCGLWRGILKSGGERGCARGRGDENEGARG